MSRMRAQDDVTRSKARRLLVNAVHSPSSKASINFFKLNSYTFVLVGYGSVDHYREQPFTGIAD